MPFTMGWLTGHITSAWELTQRTTSCSMLALATRPFILAERLANCNNSPELLAYDAPSDIAITCTMLGKTDLLEALAPVQRGLTATAADRLAIQAAATRLEDRNPTPDPLAAVGLLEGDWRLLYTTSQELLNIDRVPLASLGQIYQCIRLAENRIYNLAEVKGPPLLSGLVAVSARLEPVTQRRVNVRFERGVVGLQSLLNYQSPSQFIQTLQTTARLSLLKGIDFSINTERQAGWLEVTYLDKDLRIGRGNQGNLFVLQKVRA